MSKEEDLRVNELLAEAFNVASREALVSTVAEVCAVLGVTHLKGLPVLDYYRKIQGILVEDLNRELADSNAAVATKLKSERERISKEIEES